MAVIKNMMVRGGADFSAFTTQAKKASNSMKGMRQSVTQSCSAMKAAVSGVKSALGALGVGFSIAAIISGVREAVEAYDEQSTAEMKLATAMRNSMGARNAEIQSVLDLCSAQQKLGVISADTQTAGAQELATYLKYSASLKTLIPAMNDLAAKQYGLKASAEQVTSVATMMGKVMDGQVSALRRYGYSFSEAEEQILKYGSEADRAATLSQVVERSVGGMNAALAATPAGQMQQLSNTLGDVKAQAGECARAFGVLLLPVLRGTVNILSAAATWATRLVNSIRKATGTGELVSDWRSVSTGVTDLGNAWDGVTDSISGTAAAAKEAKRQIMGFDDLNILQDPTSSAGSSGAGSGAGLGTAPEISAQAQAVEDMAGSMAVEDMAGSMARLTQAGEDIPWLTRTLEAFKNVWDGIKKTDWSWAGIWQDLKDGAGGISDSWRMVKASVGDGLKQFCSDLDLMFIQPLRNAWSDVKDFAKNVPQSMKDWAGGISDSWRTVKDSASDAWNSVREKAGDCKTRVLQHFKDTVNGLGIDVERLRKLFRFQWELPRIKTPHLSWSSTPAGGWMAKALSALGLPTSLPKLNVNWYARGGVFDRPSLVGLGENGKEAVVPLERNTGWITRVARQLSERMQGQAAGFGSYPFAAAVRSSGSPNNDVVAALYTITGELLGAIENAGSNRGVTVLKIGEREIARATSEARRAVDSERGMSLIENFA